MECLSCIVGSLKIDDAASVRGAKQVFSALFTVTRGTPRSYALKFSSYYTGVSALNFTCDVAPTKTAKLSANTIANPK